MITDTKKSLFYQPRGKYSLKLIHASMFSLALLTFADAQAALILLNNTNQPDFADYELNNGDSVNSEGFALSFANVLTSNGGNRVLVDGDGIFLGPGGFDAASFDIVFSANLIINQYTVGYHNLGSTGGFHISGPNGISGSNNMSTNGTFAFDMGSISQFLAGQTYTLTSNVTIDLSQIKSFDVSSATSSVPSPGILPLFTTGLLLGGWMRWKRWRDRRPQ